jgi:phytoene dehydrogenase-like protein
MSLLPPTIVNDLQLARHGYKIFPMGPYYQAFPEGGSIKLYADDAKRNHEEVSRWSKRDADAMPRWDAWLAGLADVLGPLLLTVPPNLGSRKPRDLAETLRLAWRHRGLNVRTIADVTRLMTMSIAGLLDDWFESPQVKGAFAVNGVIGTWAGPYEPGTAFLDHVGRQNLRRAQNRPPPPPPPCLKKRSRWPPVHVRAIPGGHRPERTQPRTPSRRCSRRGAWCWWG